jgi:hypothetical protein
MAVMFGPSDNSLCWNTELGIGVINPGGNGATDYAWNFSSWLGYFTGYDFSPTTGAHGIAKFIVNSTTPTPRLISVRGVNVCGQSDQYWEAFSAINCSGGPGGPGGPLLLSVHPVPSNDYLSVTSDAQTNYEKTRVEIYNSYSERIYSTDSEEKTIDISVKNFPDGIYYVHVVRGKTREVRRVPIKH